jgi:peptidoglycan LD-endopeptidase CwlK
MGFILDETSQARLALVHADLRRVAELAAHKCDFCFIITEGLRDPEKQAKLVKIGASRTINSKHLTGCAVDVAAVVDGEVRWDWPLYLQIARCFKTSALELGIPITWGGDWRTFKDGPHFELVRVSITVPSL